jgi:hypothetical protein
MTVSTTLQVINYLVVLDLVCLIQEHHPWPQLLNQLLMLQTDGREQA